MTIQLKAEISIDELYAVIEQMQLEQKIELFQKLENELLTQIDAIPEWHQSLLKNRLKQYTQNPNDVISWQSFEKQLNDKYGI